jgi:uncharacterized protein YjbJ (UPF0337 family)
LRGLDGTTAAHGSQFTSAFTSAPEPAAVPLVEIMTSRRNMLMNEDRFSGTAKNITGKAEEGVGYATGDVKSQLQGKAKQMQGDLQDLYGQAKDKAADAAQSLRESAGDVDDFVRRTIEQRPYTTAVVALGIGFLIGRFAHRDY